MPPTERPATAYSEATTRVIDLALNDLAGSLDAPTVEALRDLAARGVLDDADAVARVLAPRGSDHAD